MFFDEHNPWAEKAVYVPLETAADIAEADPFLSRSFGWKSSDWITHWCRYGVQMDAYILPSRTGDHHLGIRYGTAPDQYLSFPLKDGDLLQEVLDKSNFGARTAAP